MFSDEGRSTAGERRPPLVGDLLCAVYPSVGTIPYTAPVPGSPPRCLDLPNPTSARVNNTVKPSGRAVRETTAGEANPRRVSITLKIILQLYTTCDTLCVASPPPAADVSGEGSFVASGIVLVRCRRR